MTAHIKIALVGGDARQATAAERLSKEGHSISFFAGASSNEAGVQRVHSLAEALNGASAVVLPLPSTTDGVNLNAPFYDGESIALFEILNLMPREALLVGGRIPDSIALEAEKLKIRVVDYFKSEAFQIKNAYTTAEAAISIAMGNLKKNIRGSRFAVTGYGRIARALTDLLVAFGATVSVFARKESDLAWASLAGANSIRLDADSVKKMKQGYDIIFNTVPAYLFYEDFLLEMDKGTLIVDLASSPGGVDVLAAKRIGANVLWANSLPGKYAPVSAGALIADCIADIIERIESEVAK